MITKNNKIRLVFGCFLCFCLLIVVTGCSTNENSPEESNLSDMNLSPVKTDETEDSLKEVDILELDSEPKAYDNFAEAYLDILMKNRSILTDELLSDVQIGSGMDIGKGKIAVLDVLGDETPELLYIYTVTDISPMQQLKILTYSEAKSAETVFDACVYAIAGGEGYYSVCITQDMELMVYYSRSDAISWYGFWPVVPMNDSKYAEYSMPYFNYDNSDLAKLYYADLDINGEPIYKQHGEEITEKLFNQTAKEILNGIDRVIFQGVVYPSIGLGLYKYNNFWNEITPYEESCMTYEEAVAWLEAYIDNQ